MMYSRIRPNVRWRMLKARDTELHWLVNQSIHPWFQPWLVLQTNSSENHVDTDYCPRTFGIYFEHSWHSKPVFRLYSFLPQSLDVLQLEWTQAPRWPSARMTSIPSQVRRRRVNHSEARSCSCCFVVNAWCMKMELNGLVTSSFCMARPPFEQCALMDHHQHV